MQETQVRSLSWKDVLEKEMATHSSFLAWRIPWVKEPGRLQSMGLQRVRLKYNKLKISDLVMLFCISLISSKFSIMFIFFITCEFAWVNCFVLFCFTIYPLFPIVLQNKCSERGTKDGKHKCHLHLIQLIAESLYPLPSSPCFPQQPLLLYFWVWLF